MLWSKKDLSNMLFLPEQGHTDVSADMLMKQEKRVLHVGRRVNDSKYGLQAGVFTHDLDKACRPRSITSLL